MFVHYRTLGLIFKKDDRGETDQLFTIYTKDFGKLEILGKAIRKISSKLRSGAELFYLAEIEFIQGKTQKILTDTILINKFENLRKDLKKLRIAYRISEVLNSLVKSPEPDEKIWQLLNETFEKLNNQQLTISDQQLFYYYFLWNFLSALGYTPELYNCALCQKKLTPENLYFNLKEGGVICQNCFTPLRDKSLTGFAKKEIQPETIKILRIILKKDWKTLLKLKIEAKYLKGLASISKNYLLPLCEEDLSLS